MTSSLFTATERATTTITLHEVSMGGGFLTGTQKTARSVSLGLCPGARYGDRYLVMSASTYKRRSCGDGGADRPLTRASFHTSLRLPGYAKTKTISPVVRKKKRPNIPGGRYFMFYSKTWRRCSAHYVYAIAKKKKAQKSTLRHSYRYQRVFSC